MLNNKELQDLTDFYVNWHGISGVIGQNVLMANPIL